MSCGLNGGIDLPVSFEPTDVAVFGMRFDLAEELDHVRLETRFARISIGDHRLNVDGYDEPIGSDQPCSLNSLAWDMHGAHLSKKCTVTWFAKPGLFIAEHAEYAEIARRE